MEPVRHGARHLVAALLLAVLVALSAPFAVRLLASDPAAGEVEPSQPRLHTEYLALGSLVLAPTRASDLVRGLDWHQRYDAFLALLALANGVAGLFFIFSLRNGLGHALFRRRGPISARGTPPSNLAPGLAAALLAERGTDDAIVATLIDLARRGHVQARAALSDQGGQGAPAEFELLYLRSADRLARHERRLLEALFPDGTRRIRMDELRWQLHRHLQPVRAAMLEALTGRGFFAEHPDRTRNRYLRLSIPLAVLGLALLIPAFAWPERHGGWLVGPVVELIMLGLGVGLGGWLASCRTREGRAEAAGWQAYRRFLQAAGASDTPERRQAALEEGLPYAIAFGAGRQIVQRYSAHEMPVPAWLIPRFPPQGATVIPTASPDARLHLLHLLDDLACSTVNKDIVW